MTYEEKLQARVKAVAAELKAHFTNMSIAQTIDLAFTIVAAEQKAVNGGE